MEYKIYNMDASLNEECFNRFVDTINEIPNDVKINIYLSSSGGYTSISLALIDIINTNPSRFKIIAYGKVYSCAFELFFLSNCEKVILDDVIGMYHFGWTSITMNENGKTCYYEDDAKIRHIKSKKKGTMELATRLGFSPKELKSLKKADDVYFDKDRMVELLNNLKQEPNES